MRRGDMCPMSLSTLPVKTLSFDKVVFWDNSKLFASYNATVRQSFMPVFRNGLFNQSQTLGNKSAVMPVALIIEDHPLFSNALVHLTQSVLGTEPRLVKSAEAGLDALKEDTGIQLVIMDLGLPGILKGSEAVSAIRAARPNIFLLVVTGAEDPADLNAALAAGANACICKTAPTCELAEAIRQAAAKTHDCKAPRLTERQHEVLRLLCNGLSNKEIGLRLNLSDATVKMHMTAILRSLNVATRTRAVLTARALGLDAAPTEGAGGI